MMHMKFSKQSSRIRFPKRLSSRTQSVDPGSRLFGCFCWIPRSGRGMTMAVCLSILLHILIIAGLFFHFQSNKISLGNNVALKAYIYHQPYLIAQKKKFSGKFLSAGQNNKLLQHGDLLSWQQNNCSENSLTQKTLRGKHDELLIMLHNLIQKQIAYVDALSLVAGNRKTKVAFDLLPNGHVEQVKIQHSSGLKFLDNLAVCAVKEIQPVAAAKRFLRSKRHFAVDVECLR